MHGRNFMPPRCEQTGRISPTISILEGVTEMSLYRPFKGGKVRNMNVKRNEQDSLG
jgi:hypothetical protein